MFEELLRFERDGIAEVTIFGALVLWSGGQVVASLGGDPLLYGRSLTKPYQIKPIARELRDLSLKARALSLGSHKGESFHLSALGEISTVEAGARYSPRLAGTHPCSGKHAAIIRASASRGWPLETYLSMAHPYHEAYLESLRLVLGPLWSPVHTAVDGCGLPTPTFRLSELARLYEALSIRRDDDWIWSAMTGQPELIGGTDRLDTTLMKENDGRLIAKEGADGLLGLSFAQDNRSYGLVIKVSHGHDPRALGFIAREILGRFGFKSIQGEPPIGQTAQVSSALKQLTVNETQF